MLPLKWTNFALNWIMFVFIVYSISFLDTVSITNQFLCFQALLIAMKSKRQIIAVGLPINNCSTEFDHEIGD